MNSARMAAGVETADGDPAELEPWDGWQFVDGGPLMFRGTNRKALRWCPACGYAFDKGEQARRHFELHQPRDFGL